MLLSGEGENVYFNNKLLAYLKLKKYYEVVCMFETSGNSNILNLTDLFGKKLLHYAVEYGNIAVTEHLIALGENVDVQDKQGITPLMIAIKKGRVKSILTLLRANANIYVADKQGKRQLLSCIFRFSVKMPVDVVNLFFQRIKIQTSQDFRTIVNLLRRFNCPLYLVALLRDIPIFEYLLNRGYSLTDGCVHSGNTVLHVAVQYSMLDVVKLLIERDVNVNMTNQKNQNALMMHPAVNQTDASIEILKILLSQGINLTNCSAEGKMQIYNVLKHGTRKAIHEVFKYMKDLCVKDNYGQTPLHYLMENSNEEIIEELDEKIVHVNELDNAGKSALHIAAKKAIVANVRYLLRMGADVNSCNNNERVTPLLCVMSSYILPSDAKKCTELLVRNGANIQHVNRQMKTIFDVIIDHSESNDVTRGRLRGKFYAVKPILAYLALSELRGTVNVNELIMNKINSNKRMRIYFKFCQQKLRQMKKIITPSLSAIFFKCLTYNDEAIIRFAKNRKLALKLLSAMKTFPMKTNYQIKLRNSLVKTLRLTKLKKQAVPNLFKIAMLCRNQLIVDKIISYMNEQDLRIVNQI